MKKIIRICIIIMLITCATVLIIVHNKYNNMKKEMDNSIIIIDDEYPDEYFFNEYGLTGLNLEEKKRIIKWEIHGAYELVLLMCQKNGDWSKLPISKETRERFNEKDGLLKDFEFDTIEIDPTTIGKYEYDSPPAQIILTKGNEKTKVYIDYRYYSDGLSRVEIKDVIKIIDANGNRLNEGFPFDEKHILMNFETWENVGLTDKYISNHGKELLNLFIHYSPLDYNPIGFDITKSRLENNMAYFTVTSFLESKEREYEVYYSLDKNNYLDDVDVKCVKEVELESTNKYETEKLIYKNSNWQGLKLSNNFMKFFSNNDGIIKEKNIVNYEFYKIKQNEYILKIQLQNGNIEYYYDKERYDNEGNLDDMQIEKLPYKNMSAEEVKELYLKDLQNNN